MKKLNQKQLAWSRTKAKLYAFNKMKVFMVIFAAIIMLPSLTMLARGDEDASSGVFTGVTVASLGLFAVNGNIDRAPANDTAGTQVKYKLWILEEEQWNDALPFPTRNGREVGTIPLKSGEKWHYISAVVNTPLPNSKGELTDGGMKLTNTLPFTVGGMADSILNVLEGGIGKGFYVVWEICSTGKKFLGGNGCKPMVMTAFEGGAGADSTSWKITFENQCGEIWSTFVGVIDAQADSVVAEDATAIPLVSTTNAYQLTDGSVAAVEITTFSGVTATDVGRTVIIKGSGGDNPTTIGGGNDFELVDGEEWEATQGASLTVKIFKNGAATYKFIEQSRT